MTTVDAVWLLHPFLACVAFIPVLGCVWCVCAGPAPHRRLSSQVKHPPKSGRPCRSEASVAAGVVASSIRHCGGSSPTRTRFQEFTGGPHGLALLAALIAPLCLVRSGGTESDLPPPSASSFWAGVMPLAAARVFARRQPPSSRPSGQSHFLGRGAGYRLMEFSWPAPRKSISPCTGALAHRHELLGGW